MDFQLGVIGLGYVGLPLCVAFLSQGYKVFGFDTDVNTLNNISHLTNRDSYKNCSIKFLRSKLKERKFVIDSKGDLFSECEVIVICVPTPLDADGRPDISHILNASELAAKKISDGTTVILESTSFPGTTRDYVLPIFEKNGFILGKNFYLGFSSERVDPGSEKYNLTNCDKTFSGIDKISHSKIEKFYEKILDKKLLHGGSNPENVEFAKLLENSYRLLNIQFINSLSISLKNSRINLSEAIDLAGTKPFGFEKFTPSPGVGGHCIPVDPIFMYFWMKEYLGENNLYLELSINDLEKKVDYISDYVIQNYGKNDENLSLVIYGMTFKPNVGDFRNSPSIAIIKKIDEIFKNLYLVDPFIDQLDTDKLNLNPNLNIYKSKDLLSIPVEIPTLILVNHKVIQSHLIEFDNRVIIDTVNALKIGNNVVKI
jgi:UDP-N-acetyl-D-glucosamine dehydrogenase